MGTNSGTHHTCGTCADPESFLRGVQLFFSFFLVYDWIQIPLKSGHHRPASETPLKWCFAGVPMMAFRWHADDGPILNAGLVTL